MFVFSLSVLSPWDIGKFHYQRLSIANQSVCCFFDLFLITAFSVLSCIYRQIWTYQNYFVVGWMPCYIFWSAERESLVYWFGVCYWSAWRNRLWVGLIKPLYYCDLFKALKEKSLNLCFVTVCSVCGTVWTCGCATLGRDDGSHFCLHCEYRVYFYSDGLWYSPAYSSLCFSVSSKQKLC